MSNQSLGNRVQEQLAQALANGKLPAAVEERAMQLLARLRQPVRLGIMGKPGSGKSALLNLLVGREVLPDDVRLPTAQVAYGERAQAVCTLGDGTKQQLDTANAYDIAELKPVFVEISMPLPALAKISVLEVVTSNDPTAIHRASQWAAKRCDLALWCTQSFDTNEQAIWAQMPDVLKDHSFLMLTKADVLTANGMLDQTLEATRSVAADEFNQILPLATLDAIAARHLDGSIDKEQMRRSGGLALIAAVLKQVEQGRQSVVDTADMLLHQHVAAISGSTPAPAPDEDAPDEDKNILQAVIGATGPKPVAAQEPVIPPVAASAPVVPPEPERATPQPDADEIVVAINLVSLKPETRDAYQHALQYITEHGRALVDLAAELGDAAATQVMAETVEHVQWLSEYLNAHGNDADDALLRARDTAMDAADIVQLMQMEKRDSAAIEAVSVLLQIKHELQADLAA